VPWLLPIPVKLGLPPVKRLRITTGKRVETFIVLPLLIAFNLFWYATHSQEILDFLQHHIVH
jgi:hypothetical protein